MRARLLLAILFLLLLSGCQTLAERSYEKTLSATMKAYASTMRWGYPGQMYNFLHKDLSEKTTIPENLQNITITNYKVVQSPVPAGKNRVQQMAVIGYVFDDQQIERSLTDRQLWEYDEEGERWSRINPIPEFK